MLFADQAIVLLVQIIAIVLHVLQRVRLFSVVVLRSYIVVQLRSVLFLVLVTHLFQLLLSQPSVLTFIYYLFLL